MDEMPTSPIPRKNNVVAYSFPDVIKELILGRKITRLEWGTNDEYGVLKDGLLMIYGGNKRDSQFHPWILSDGDLLACDWVLLPEAN